MKKRVISFHLGLFVSFNFLVARPGAWEKLQFPERHERLTIKKINSCIQRHCPLDMLWTPFQCQKQCFLWWAQDRAVRLMCHKGGLRMLENCVVYSKTHITPMLSTWLRQRWGGDSVNYLLLLFRFPAARRSGALLTLPIHSLVIWRRSSVRHTPTECW